MLNIKCYIYYDMIVTRMIVHSYILAIRLSNGVQYKWWKLQIFIELSKYYPTQGEHCRLGPAQDVPFALIIWYVAKTIYLF